jgi:hypothetical protein
MRSFSGRRNRVGRVCHMGLVLWTQVGSASLEQLSYVSSPEGLLKPHYHKAQIQIPLGTHSIWWVSPAAVE